MVVIGGGGGEWWWCGERSCGGWSWAEKYAVFLMFEAIKIR